MHRVHNEPSVQKRRRRRRRMSLSDKNERDDDDVDPYRLKVHHCFEKKENVLVNARPAVQMTALRDDGFFRSL